MSQATLSTDTVQQRKMDFVNELKTMPIAVLTEKANEQHYEVRVVVFILRSGWYVQQCAAITVFGVMQLPTEYFDKVLGRWKKYSSCLYRDVKDDLDTAEENMLGVGYAYEVSGAQRSSYFPDRLSERNTQTIELAACRAVLR